MNTFAHLGVRLPRVGLAWVALLGIGFGGALTITRPAIAADDEEEETFEPEDVTLTTSDDVEIKATFYPSNIEKKKRKDAVPVIALHASKGDRGDCRALAIYLQSLGHAVITPDLRGHGESKVNGVDANRLRAGDIELMVNQDMEAIKRFLKKKNNQQQLNIEKLCVVGAEMGATVAINWAATDWMYEKLPTGKQGQDVKRWC